MSDASFHLPVVGETARVDALDELFAAGFKGGGGPHPLGEGPGAAEAAAALHRVLDALRGFALGQPSVVFDLAGLSEAALAELDDALGQGEVSVKVDGHHRLQIRETGLPGLWRIHETTERDSPVRELLEIAEVPSVVRAADALATCDDLSIGKPPDGTMNALPVLAELRHRMKRWQEGEPNHVISFTLLPMNEVDMRYLEGQLGRGPVLGESTGYGRCRVELTGHRHIWSVQFFNSGGALILDTLEVGDVPISLRAGAEDLQDSAARLAELLGR